MDEISSSYLWLCIQPHDGYIWPKHVADLYIDKAVEFDIQRTVHRDIFL